ncbi:MAG: mannose-6-phosphate isomerase, partial [Phycisphaerae bacterium]|nr:mannose-6-phosphate isomerase [Phycisphaerae bacterium]
MSVYPYKFEPVYKEKIWGGRALERLFGRDLPAGEKIGESWELADLPEGQSVVSNGPDAGKTLNSLLAEKADEILGPNVTTDEGRFPLLLKLLDANDILSLQVHPDE